MQRRRSDWWLWAAPPAALAAGAFALFVLQSPTFWLYECVPFAVFLVALHRFSGSAAWNPCHALLMLWCVAIAFFPLAYGALLASH